MIVNDTFFDICLDICPRECKCLLSRVQEYLQPYIHDIAFKHFCLSNPTRIYYRPLNYSDQRLVDRVVEYVFDRRIKVDNLVQKSLFCLPNVLNQLCREYMFISLCKV